MGETLLNTEQAAQWLGVQPSTMVSWRVRGDGPPFAKIGRQVRYRSTDLGEWIERQLRTSTSDPGA